MSVGPRVVFTRFASGASPKLDPWRDHAHRVMGHEPEFVAAAAAIVTSAITAGHTMADAAAVNSSAIVWHLVSANNRMLARSAQIFGEFEDAVEIAERTIASAAHLDVSYVGDESRGMHGWMAFDSGVAVMTCARWYLSDRDRRHSIDLALTSIGTALLRPGTRLIDPALHGGVREPI